MIKYGVILPTLGLQSPMMGIPLNHAGRATGVHPYSIVRLPENETGYLDE
jgi:hypothetical protein